MFYICTNVYGMSVIRTYYILKVVTVMWPATISCVTSLSFTTFLWPHVIVKCSSDAHFRILSELLGHPATFCLLFYEYYEIGHATHFTYCFSPTI